MIEPLVQVTMYVEASTHIDVITTESGAFLRIGPMIELFPVTVFPASSKSPRDQLAVARAIFEHGLAAIDGAVRKLDAAESDHLATGVNV